MGWFEVDRGGLRQLLEGRDKAFIIRELVQNAWDEPGVTRCDVVLEIGPGRSMARLIVTDDAPEGFVDISHAYTLFAHTRKRSDADRRGRFNMGEKQVLALCAEARIVTTTGSVIFKGTERSRGRERTEAGSEFRALIPMTRAEIVDAIRAAQTFLPPRGIRYTLNGDEVPRRDPWRTLETTLTTEYEDAEGRYRTTRRKTTIDVHVPREGERAMIFEMGLPIVETGDRYHYNIGQRVPMNMDRDNVSAAFLRDVRAEVLNATASQIGAEHISDAWVRDAMSDERIASEAVQRVVQVRWGDRVAVGVPGDAKSREEAISHGYRVVTGSEMSEAEWDAVRAAGAIEATTHLFPVARADARGVDEAEITPAMRMVEAWAKRLAHEVFGFKLKVQFIESPGAVLADYDASKHLLRFNVQQLGRAWFGGSRHEILKLIIHELGHEGGGHLEHGYHECLCEIAAHLAVVDTLIENN
jgi:hypothetical protein